VNRSTGLAGIRLRPRPSYDVNSRITELQETGLATKYYGYDSLDRLTSYFDGTTTNGYNYDADGNRT
jgi:large repetitive protein